MNVEEFLKRLIKESLAVEELNKRNYYTYLDALFKMTAYDGNRLNKKYNLMITPYLQYLSNIERDDFKENLSKKELEEVIENIKAELDCMIFKIDKTDTK